MHELNCIYLKNILRNNKSFKKLVVLNKLPRNIGFQNTCHTDFDSIETFQFSFMTKVKAFQCKTSILC